MQLSEGKKAPDFTLPDQTGTERSLSDYKGKWVLLYFYPKDDTPGCTTEACSLRDSLGNFEKLGMQILGVSTDSVASHKKFSEKFKLPFPLLADTEKKVVELYGVWGEKKFMGRTYMGTKRVSFLIDPQGKIAKIYAAVKPKEHAQEVLEEMSSS